ncbi:NERD domain-containing protein [Cytobacillus oceanisediminis]|uniref:NERD domain-containing protein n=1 Tax=Cytobacillus oceanisediminis TaxID=665099 RepID=UPI003736E5CC
MIFLYMLLLILALVFSMPKVKGLIGEGWVRYFLRKLDPEKYIVMNSILLPADEGKTTQIDHLIISVYGIFAIETKNYKGWIYGSEKSKNWTQVIYKKKEKFHNPVFQNYSHIKAVENIIRDEFQPPFYSIIAFNTKATLKKIDIESKNVRVVYDNRILKAVNEFREPVLSKNEMKRIQRIILNKKIAEKHVNKQHVKAIKTVQIENKKKVSAGICPNCGGALTKRSGKHGPFTGCSNYPKCRFTA